MEKKKILLPSKKFYNATDETLNVRVGLNESQILLREGDRNIILDINELFNKERDESVKYKIHGKIKMVFSNLYVGETSYEPLLKNLYLTDVSNGYVPYNEFAFLRNDSIREKNVLSTKETLDDYDPTIVIDGYTGHTTITTIDAPYKNWNIYLSYVHDQDENYPLTYTLSGDTNGDNTFNFVSSDGIPFRVEAINKTFKFTSPVEHGMNVGEYVIINNTPLYITSIGDEIFNSEKYVVNVIENDIPSGFTFNDVVFGKRCVDVDDIENTTSKYYIHKHKILTETEDYILDSVGFESPIWKDEKKIIFENALGENDVIVEKNRMESLIYDFKEPFILSGITNNLGYTPTDVYLTVIFRNGNGYFEYPPKVGYKFNFHNTWLDSHFKKESSNESNLTQSELETNTEGFTFYSGVGLNKDDELIGNYIEYNGFELKERVVSNVFHKIIHRSDIFNHGQSTDENIYGVNELNKLGLFYQPHHQIKLRQLSTYIDSTETEDIINLPENTKYFENDGVWKWRDLYDHGFIDPDGNGLDYPFINGTHYVKNDINFYLRNEKVYKNKEDGIKKVKRFDC
jgi:hypothetical protein